MQKNAIFSLTEYERTKCNQRMGSDQSAQEAEGFLAKLNSLMLLVNEIATKVPRSSLELLFFKGANVAKLSQELLMKKA